MAQIIDVVMRLTDNVTGGLNRIRNAMEQSAKANQRMGRTLQNAGRHVGNLSDAMMPLAAGITGVGALGVKTFMDFDATMTAAGVKAGATAEEMQQMKDAAAQMGAKFPTTAVMWLWAWTDWRPAASTLNRPSAPCRASSKLLLRPVKTLQPHLTSLPPRFPSGI